MISDNDLKLADNLLTNSVKLEPGQSILIQLIGLNGIGLARGLVQRTREMDAHPFLELQDTEIHRMLLEQGDEAFWKRQTEIDQLPLMKQMDAFVGIRASENIYETSRVPEVANKAYADHFLQPVHFEQRVNHTNWCVLRYPSPAFAMNAGMPTEAFNRFYYRACLLDYSRLCRAMDPLENKLRAGNEIHLKGEGTDIRFSIAGQPWVRCCGDRNLPDGELFTSPVIDSVNGEITYAPSIYQGKHFDWIWLKVESGEVVDFDAPDREQLRGILDTDEGARRFGEFSFGLNPVIEEPMSDILFDEKIYGSNHLTLGQAYDIAPNGNRSSIHWDLVCIGADVYLDGELLRRGRRFVDETLEPLNPEHLLNGQDT